MMATYVKPITDHERQEPMQRLGNRATLYGTGSGGGIGYHTKKLKDRDRGIMEALTV